MAGQPPERVGSASRRRRRLPDGAVVALVLIVTTVWIGVLVSLAVHLVSNLV